MTPLSIVATVTLLIQCLSIDSLAQASPAPEAAPDRTKWEFTKWLPFGDRELSAGFMKWGPRPVLVLHLTKVGNAKQIPISRLKVTALDQNGKPIKVEKYYQHPHLISSSESDAAFFDLGTPVQKVKPSDVSSITVVGFGGKVTVRFMNGEPVPE